MMSIFSPSEQESLSYPSATTEESNRRHNYNFDEGHEFKQDLKRKTMSLRRLRNLIDHNDELLKKSLHVKRNLIDFAEEHEQLENKKFDSVADNDAENINETFHETDSTQRQAEPEPPPSRNRNGFQSVLGGINRKRVASMQKRAAITTSPDANASRKRDTTCKQSGRRQRSKKKPNEHTRNTSSSSNSITMNREMRANIHAMWEELGRLRRQTESRAKKERIVGIEAKMQQLAEHIEEIIARPKRDSMKNRSLISDRTSRRLSCCEKPKPSSSVNGKALTLNRRNSRRISTSSSSPCSSVRYRRNSIPEFESFCVADKTDEPRIAIDNALVERKCAAKVAKVEKNVNRLGFDVRQLRVEVEKLRGEQIDASDMRRLLRSQQKDIDDVSSTVRAVRTKQHSLSAHVHQHRKDHESLVKTVEQIEQKLIPHAHRMKEFSHRISELSKRQEELAGASELISEQFKLVLMKFSRQDLSESNEYSEAHSPQQEEVRTQVRGSWGDTSGKTSSHPAHRVATFVNDARAWKRKVPTHFWNANASDIDFPDSDPVRPIHSRYEKLKRAYYRVFQES